MDDYKNIGSFFGVCGVIIWWMMHDREDSVQSTPTYVPGGVPRAPHSPTCWHL